MQPRIEKLPEKRLIGMCINVSLAQDKSFELWPKFMSKRKEIKNTVSSDIFSLRIYGQPQDIGDMTKSFAKWAALEVSGTENIPPGMEACILPGGLYAVFHYIGSSSDHSIFAYIYGTWLPASQYIADDRPHFEILGAKYKNNDPSSEEEIWIPIKIK